MKFIKYILIAIFALCLNSCKKSYHAKHIKPSKNYSAYISQAKNYTKANKLSKRYFLLADLGVHSGKKRLFLYDFKLQRFTESFMVLHGKGHNGRTSRRIAEFSNKPKSYCSSLGKYILNHDEKVSLSYGHKFLLKGMQASNSNAEVRQIVLHPSRYAPNNEKFPKYLNANSKGCPAVSPDSFEILEDVIDSENKDILFWVIK